MDKESCRSYQTIRNPANTRMHPERIPSEGQPGKLAVVQKVNSARESFWKDALQADSLLMWIVSNIGRYLEDRP